MLAVSARHLTHSQGIHEVSVTAPTLARAAPSTLCTHAQASRHRPRVQQVGSAPTWCWLSLQTALGASLGSLRNSVQVLGEEDTPWRGGRMLKLTNVCNYELW